MSSIRKKRKLNPSNSNVANQSSFGRITEPPLQISDSERSQYNDLSTISTRFQLTVRFRISEIQRREVSLLLAVLNYEAVNFGVRFQDYLCIEHCVNYLIGSKGDPWEIRDNKERVSTLTSLVILKNLRGQTLVLDDRQSLDKETQEYVSKDLLLTSRQYGSVRQNYNVSRYLTLRAVPLETFMEREDKSVRYDSYCKGYKDGGSAAPKKKTRYSAELDGEDSEKPIEFPLEDYPKYQTIQFLLLTTTPLKK